MQLKHSVIAAAVTVVLASIGGEARATGSSQSAATVTEARGAFLQQGQSLLASREESRLATPEKKPTITGVVFDHVMLDELDIGFIVPCVKVLTRLYKQAQHDDSLGVELRLIYTSNGNVVQKLLVAPLSEYQLTTHHSQPKKKKWKLVDIEVDVSSTMPDAGTTFKGQARLIELGSLATANDREPAFNPQAFVALGSREHAFANDELPLPNIEIPSLAGAPTNRLGPNRLGAR